jgi:hypothetical protein
MGYYIHITGQAGPCIVYTATDRGSVCPRAESPKFPSFSDFPPAKRVLSTRSSKIPEIYRIIKNIREKKGYESVDFRLRRARPEIHRPWTCSRSETYMHHLDPQIHLLWSTCIYNRPSLSLAESSPRAARCCEDGYLVSRREHHCLMASALAVHELLQL